MELNEVIREDEMKRNHSNMVDHRPLLSHATMISPSETTLLQIGTEVGRETNKDEGRFIGMHNEINSEGINEKKGEKDVSTFNDSLVGTRRHSQSASKGHSIRDDRKCDYEIVKPNYIGMHTHSANIHRRSSRLSVETPVSTSETVQSNTPNSWRHILELHVKQLLQQFRLNREELFVFMRVHDKSEGESMNEKKNEDGEIIGRKKSTNFSQQGDVNVKEIYMKYYRMGIKLGEVLYHQVHRIIMKSVSLGILPREANAVRFASVYQLELRRQVTIDRVRYEVLGQHAMNQKKYIQRRNTMIKSIEEPMPSESMEKSDTRSNKTTHLFKMQALERLLAMARMSDRHYPHASTASVDRTGQMIPLTESFKEQVQEKLTTMIYTKQRESFPFWKSPPQNSFSREETLSHLRTILAVFSTMMAFRTLAVDQLIELVRSTTWKTFSTSGDIICQQNDPIHHLIVVMEGSVEMDDGTNPVISIEASAIPPDRYGMTHATEWKNYYGELGLLSKTEHWAFSLRVVTTANILLLDRDAFDSALQRIFPVPGMKRTGKIIGNTINAPKRSDSFPSALFGRSQSFYTPRGSGGGAVSLHISSPEEKQTTTTESALNAIKAQNLEIYRQYCEAMSMTVTPATEETEKNIEQVDEPVLRVLDGERLKDAKTTWKVFQEYPSFAREGGNNTMRRLKWSHPIAFGMESMTPGTLNEWSPMFPDTNSLVESMNIIAVFEQPNLLLKEQLRHVYLHTPMIVSERAKICLTIEQDKLVDDNTGNSNHQAQGIDATSSGTRTLAEEGNEMSRRRTLVGDGQEMTLYQFVEARQESFEHGSDENDRVEKTVPFTGSSFVAESRFQDSTEINPPPVVPPAIEQDPTQPNRIIPPINSNVPMNQSIPSQSSIVPSQNVITLSPKATVPHQKSITPLQKSTVALDMEGSEEEDFLEIDESDEEDAIPSLEHVTQGRKASVEDLIRGISTPTKKKAAQPTKTHRRKRPIQTPTNHLTSPSKYNNAQDSAASNTRLPLRADLQQRMEVVFDALQMNPQARLDLVLKYTHIDHYHLFADSVIRWERVMQAIQTREQSLAKLREFELVASDPRRHFRSLSTNRLIEQKQRDTLFSKLKETTDHCRSELQALEEWSQDVVYYHQRLYQDKMMKDYTELLYEVEQERLQIIYKHQPSKNKSAPLPTEEMELNGQPFQKTSQKFILPTPRSSIFKSPMIYAEEDKRAEEQSRRREGMVQRKAQGPLSVDVQPRERKMITSPRVEQVIQHKSVQEVRPPQSVQPISNDMDGLKQILQHYLKRF